MCIIMIIVVHEVNIDIMKRYKLRSSGTNTADLHPSPYPTLPLGYRVRHVRHPDSHNGVFWHQAPYPARRVRTFSSY